MLETYLDKNWVAHKPSTAENVEIRDLKNRFISTINKAICEYKTDVKSDEEEYIPQKENISKDYFHIPNYLDQFYTKQSTIFFSKVQKWFGTVLEVNSKTFTAKLEDITHSGTNEIGEFDIDEVSTDDKELLSVGSGFYWSIGTARINGQAKKESIIKFQRNTFWTAEDYDAAFDRADFLYNNLKWD